MTKIDVTRVKFILQFWVPFLRHILYTCEYCKLLKKFKIKAFRASAFQKRASTCPWRDLFFHSGTHAGPCSSHPWGSVLFCAAVSQLRKTLHIPGSHSLNEGDPFGLLWQPRMFYPCASTPSCADRGSGDPDLCPAA